MLLDDFELRAATILAELGRAENEIAAINAANIMMFISSSNSIYPIWFKNYIIIDGRFIPLYPGRHRRVKKAVRARQSDPISKPQTRLASGVIDMPNMKDDAVPIRPSKPKPRPKLAHTRVKGACAMHRARHQKCPLECPRRT